MTKYDAMTVKELNGLEYSSSIIWRYSFIAFVLTLIGFVYWLYETKGYSSETKAEPMFLIVNFGGNFCVLVLLVVAAYYFALNRRYNRALKARA